MLTPLPSNPLEPRQDAAAKLLLLTARSELTDAQAKETQQLAAQVSDWDDYVETSTKKFSIPFSYRHLNAFAADFVPEPTLARMRQLAKLSGLTSLKIASAQVAFHKACIEPLGVRYVYMKGIALSRQFNREIADRYSRDVDVLVEENSFQRVVLSAVKHGYKLMMDHDPLEFATSRQDVAFMAKHAEVATLIGDDGVHIEVHRRLGKLGLKFDLNEILDNAEYVELFGTRIKTIPKATHFIYICSHHSRHFWSRLHWLADLNAMTNAFENDRDEIVKKAEMIGIGPTIEASFEFNELAAQPDLWDLSDSAPPGGQHFLKACLINLNGGLEIEQALRTNLALGDFMADWQVSETRHSSLWRNTWVRRLTPNVQQYKRRKLPAVLHWIYYLQNASLLCKNVLNRVRGKSSKRTEAHRLPNSSVQSAGSKDTAA